MPEIHDALASIAPNGMLGCLLDQLTPLDNVVEKLTQAIDPDAPALMSEGHYIKSGYNAELDKLREASRNGHQWIADLEAKERELTGIKNLKIQYNRVFGYYIEVTKSNYEQVPYRYTRKQTLANCERYMTPELHEIQETVLGAQEKAVRLEQGLFIEIREFLSTQIPRIQHTAVGLKTLDALVSLAVAAVKNRYVRPEITEDGVIDIEDGRHPVVEAGMHGDEQFVPNSTLLDDKDNRMLIITGPNMAGKSTYMRQVALITLMAHMGSFVPAESAKIGIVDRIFTRVGASDDLASGQSTFMVEMNEMAHILRSATSKSLIVLDEIGRGTSTFDGLSIAWAVVEYLVDKKKIGAKTLFATHYHELSELEGRLGGVVNYRISVKEHGEDIIFLRKIERGGADKSFGIHVAHLAGMPRPVIMRAHEILARLETNDVSQSTIGQNILGEDEKKPKQVNLFEAPAMDLVEEIRALDVMSMTPIEALNTLFTLKEKARKGIKTTLKRERKAAVEDRPILRLDQELIGKIAAGEVVESPASAIKELVENSLDAGSTCVTVEIRDGGIAYLRVTDNGRGIRARDVRMAFERHATSKITKSDDLFALHTLGFRGEALASIAAVSKLTLTTKSIHEETRNTRRQRGWRDQGDNGSGQPAGHDHRGARTVLQHACADSKFLEKADDGSLRRSLK